MQINEAVSQREDACNDVFCTANLHWGKKKPFKNLDQEKK